MRSGAVIEPGEIRVAGRVVEAKITDVEEGIDIAFSDVFDRGGLLELSLIHI